jgi:hypothetical protein
VDIEHWVPRTADCCEVESAVDTDMVAQALNSSLALADIPVHRMNRVARVVALAGRTDKAVRVVAAVGKAVVVPANP